MSNVTSVRKDSVASVVRTKTAVRSTGCAICGCSGATVAFKGRMICGDCLAFVKQCL